MATIPGNPDNEELMANAAPAQNVSEDLKLTSGSTPVVSAPPAPEPAAPTVEVTSQPTVQPTVPGADNVGEWTNIYSKVISDRQQGQDATMQRILNRAAQGDPELAATTKMLSDRLGVPAVQITNNIDEFKKRLAQQNTRQAAAQVFDPILRRQLSDPEFAALAHDDIFNLDMTTRLLNWSEKVPGDIATQFESGQFIYGELGQLQSKAQMGTITEEETARMKILQDEAKKFGEAQTWIGEGSKLIGQMSVTLPKAMEFGVESGMVAGTAAFFAGQAGPQVLLPEEIVTVPAAFIGAFMAGTVAMTAKQTYEIESGENYISMIEEGVDKQTAQYVSTGVGVVNAALEVVGLGVVTKPIKAALIRATTEEVAKALSKPTVKGALKNFAVSYAEIYGAEVAVEILQEISAITGEEIAKSFGENEMQSLIETEEGRQIIAERLGKVTTSVAQAMILLAGVGPAANYTFEYRAAKRAEKDAAFFNDLANQAADSKVKQRSPNAYQAFIAEQTDGGPQETIYMDAEQVVNVLRQNGLDVSAADAVIPGISEQITEAANTGGDVQISTAEFAAKLAGTDIGTALQPHMRTNQDGVSAFEAAQIIDQQKQLMKEAEAVIEEQSVANEEFKQSAANVRSQVLEQIKQTKIYNDNVARNYADFVRNFVVTQAAAMKMMPEEFYAQYMYKVQGENQAQAELFNQEGQIRLESPQFQDFFGDSVLVDEQGAPLRVYHGTADEVTEFDIDHPNRKDSGWLGTGVYLTDNATLGAEYANQKVRSRSPKGQRVMPLYARLENPYMATMEDKKRIKEGGREAADAFTADLQAQGYDGVILQVAPDAREIVVFEPSSVKSEFNSGTWSRETADLLAQRGAPKIEGQSSDGGNKHGLNPHLRVKSRKRVPKGKKPLFAQSTMNSTAPRQIAAIDEVLGRHPNATDSVENWIAMMVDALATNDVPAPPYAFIKNLNGTGSVDLLATLTDGQIADADHGFENAAGFRDDYVNGRISIEDTGRLFLWSFLSRGVSPYTQESLFIDSFDGIGEWIAAAADGTLEGRLDEYEAWAKSAAPKGSGQPGAGATHNLNAFGKTFLVKMSQEAGDGTGRSRLQVLHDMMSDPESTGKQVRRKFLEMGEGVGIDNKVVSFTLLVAGYDDVMVLDRVQVRELWNDGRFDDINLYDGYKQDGKPVAGSSLASLTMGARGLLIYEAIEAGLQKRIVDIYSTLGRAEAASIGRYHWETWVASSNQEASHATIDAILAAARGNTAPLKGVTAKEGEYGAFAYGARYGRDGLGVPYFLYSVPGVADYKFSVEGFREFLTQIKQRDNGILPPKFKVTESGNKPWYFRDGVNLENLAALAERTGERYESDSISETDAKNGIDQPVSNRLAAGESSGFRQLARTGETGNVIFEVAPDPNNAELSGRWNELSGNERLEISGSIANEIVPDVLSAVGATGSITTQVGSYLDDTNPSFAIRLESGNTMEVAKALGFVLSQDSMMAIAPEAFDGSFEAGAIRIDIGNQTEAEIDAIYQAIRAIEGQPQIQGQTTTNGQMTILLDESMDAEALASAIDETLGGQYQIVTHMINAAFPEKQEYDYASSQSDPAGNEGVARQRYRDARAKAEQLLERAITDIGNRGRGYSSGSLAPLEGAPTVDGAAGPDANLVAVAEQYARTAGIILNRQAEYVDINPEFSARLAEAYDQMEHAPQDPAVREAYQNLVEQTMAQYDALVEAGYEFYFFDETNDPYAGNPWNAMRDLRENKRMAVFATEAGFGSGATEINVEDNPLLQDTGLEWMYNGEPKRVLANDLFRAVHDAFGHGMEGAGFRARGEENAWQAHARLFTGSALAALTSETRGQNSWLNFGPYGEKNQLAKVEDTIFADQKTGLMPEWTWTEGVVGDMEVAPAPVQPGTLAQEGDFTRGGFDPKNLTTILYEKADYSTFLHETGHFFLTVYADMAARPDATEQMKADMQTLLDWFGVADLDSWNAMTLDEQRKYHEQFAYSFEIYLFEGQAPSVQMQTLFDRFSAFLKSVYRNIRDELNTLYKQETGEDLPILTGEVRQVMDRMIASEEQIEMAEEVRGMKPMFQTQEQSGMTDEQWAEYQAIVDEAHQDAVTDLTKASVRQMKWLQNARAKHIKKLQSEASEKRKETAKSVTSEVKSLPVYRAIEFFKRGTLDGQPVDNAVKLSIAEIEEMYGKGEMLDSIRKTFGFGKYGILGKDNGIHPDQAAEILGFSSGYAMVQQMLNARPMKEEIALRTDRKMLEENGELSDPKAMDRAVEEALHNEARARFIAAELRFVAKINTPVRVMRAAAKQAAQAMLSSKKLGELKVRDFTSAERRAAREAIKAQKEGRSADVIKAKQNQMMQNTLANEAIAIRAEYEKAIKTFKKLFKADAKMAKRMNMDLIDAARSIISYYGIGPKGKSPAEFVEKLRSYNPELYADLEPMILDAARANTSMKDLTVEDFRALRDAIEGLMFRARRDKQIMIEGNKLEMDDVVQELVDRLDEIGVPDLVPGEAQAASPKDKAVRQLQHMKAATRRVESWADATDGPTGTGPFTKYIWRPIRHALDKYRTDRNYYVKKFAEMLGQIKLPTGKIEARELGYTFGNANGGIGKAEVLGAMLHMGNAGNLRKLLLGRGWGSLLEDGTLDTTRWDAFIARMFSENIITKSDMDWVQSVWDLNEELKPLAQKAHHDIFGYYFAEIEASPVVTPVGTYKGGYVPAAVDPFLVRDAERNAKMEQLESDFRNAMPSTGMGFTKGRVEYNKPLSLDVRLMAKHIDDVIRFAHVQPAITDVLRLLRRREFADKLTRLDPTAIENMLLPWLNRAARQQTMEPGMVKAIDKFWSGVRNRTGVSIMFANITNAVQQFTGLFPAALKVDGKYLRKSLMRYTANPHKTANAVAELSPFMADRMENQIFDIQETMNDLLLNPNKFQKVQSWATKHGYFLQQAFQNFVDVVVWSGKYNEVLENAPEGMTEKQLQKEAIAQADAAVRLTQDSLAPEDIANFQAGSPFYKTLIQFSGYFNMLANLNSTEYIKVIRDLGFKGNKGKLVYIYIMGFMMPMIMSDAIVRTLGGQWDDEDDDGYLDEIAEWFFGSQIRGATALIPAFGPGLVAVSNAFNDKPYDDRMATSPSVSMLEASTIGVAKAGINLVDPDKEVTGKNVRDVLTAISLATGIPIAVLGRPIGYAVEVERGNIDPTGPIDYARGLITGKASEASR